MLVLTILTLITTKIKANDINSTLTKSSELVSKLDTNRNFKLIINKLDTNLNSIAKGLKLGIQETWNVLLKQQKIKSIYWLTFLIISTISFIPFYKLIKYLWNKNEEGSKFTCIVLCAIKFSIFFYVSCHYMTTLTGLFNPEYGAFLDILTFTQNIK